MKESTNYAKGARAERAAILKVYKIGCEQQENKRNMNGSNAKAQHAKTLAVKVVHTNVPASLFIGEKRLNSTHFRTVSTLVD